MSTQDVTLERIHDALEELADDQLSEVLRYVEALKNSAAAAPHVAEIQEAPLYKVHTEAIGTGIPDLAQQHDHYLYGLDKRNA